MCGIALIISGVRIDLSSILDGESAQSCKSEQVVFSIDELEAALLRRGPDSLGSKKVLLRSSISISVEDSECVSPTNGEAHTLLESSVSSVNYGAELQFFGATLQLRGVYPIIQPLVDSSESILVYNGEIFGGLCVDSDTNDAEVLMQYLGSCCSCNNHGHSKTCDGIGKGQSSVPDVISKIKGPWAFIYWQNKSRTLWFGRDAFGRRSLLVHWPTAEDSRLLLSSVSPLSNVEQSPFENGHSSQKFWEELPCAVYSISMDSLQLNECFCGEVRKHEWANPLLKELIRWERSYVIPETEKVYFSNHKILGGQHDMHSAFSDRNSVARPIDASVSVPAQRVLMALRESVMQRTSLNTIFQAVSSDVSGDAVVPVAVLFSGGLDSMILAALLEECLDPRYEIDLLNVSFDGHSAPDRISANTGLKELRRIAPLRRWNLVEIDADLSKLTWEIKHVMSLINPANTYMDLNIGIALWLAAGGDGWVYKLNNDNNEEVLQRVKYKSNSRILLVGAGADEQCAGYGRHRTKYRNRSWLGLHEEMKLDMQRIWKRNLGRDDRCIADNGKEARFPFLDENVIKTLLDFPLWEIANLDQPSGIGDKKILREVAKLLGLHEAAVLPKRAIQFGSRIARESNRKNFGSNRAANQASAGSVVIQMP